MKVRLALLRWVERREPRLVLIRDDGLHYLKRWGFSTRFGGVFIHRMDTSDPGIDLHDHPWPFVSLILAGGYTEQSWASFSASLRARWAEGYADDYAIDSFHHEYLRILKRGLPDRYKAGSVNVMGLGRAHRIVACEPGTWSLVFHGPRRRDRRNQLSDWGFYTVHGWMDEFTYDETYRDRPLVAHFREGVTR
jgi:hypothetical protein